MGSFVIFNVTRMIAVTKLTRIRWAGHVAHVVYMKDVQKCLAR
jgi:hypothetical protein